MKRNLLFISAVVLFSTKIFSQTIPNSSFDNWTSMGNYSDPDSWSTLNSVGDPLGVYTVTPGTPAQQGTYYLKIVSKTMGPGVLPGLATTGTINSSNQTISGGYPFTSRPANLTGKWEYMAMSGTDQGMIGVLTTKWNTSTNSRDTICATQYMLPGMVMSWASFSIPLTYVGTGFPDTCLIVLASSTTAPTANSYLWIDALAFSGTVGINETQANQNNLNVYPNPAENLLNVSFNLENSSSVKIQLFDISGKLIEEFNPNCSIGENTIPLNLEGIERGIYFVRLVSDKGTDNRKIVVE
ncbi:MAG TPA: T9SS type A sorting domain-containing protein [Bacteroidia bacterium]|nr:T9SS type A sorting domain-containing protein [Bacteroidia bacterium]